MAFRTPPALLAPVQAFPFLGATSEIIIIHNMHLLLNERVDVHRICLICKAALPLQVLLFPIQAGDSILLWWNAALPGVVKVYASQLQQENCWKNANERVSLCYTLSLLGILIKLRLSCCWNEVNFNFPPVRSKQRNWNFRPSAMSMRSLRFGWEAHPFVFCQTLEAFLSGNEQGSRVNLSLEVCTTARIGNDKQQASSFLWFVEMTPG